MKLITIITPCFNEQANVEICAQAVKEIFASIEGYEYEHIFADNSSTDQTRSILTLLAEKDSKIHNKEVLRELNGYLKNLAKKAKQDQTSDCLSVKLLILFLSWLFLGRDPRRRMRASRSLMRGAFADPLAQAFPASPSPKVFGRGFGGTFRKTGSPRSSPLSR